MAHTDSADPFATNDSDDTLTILILLIAKLAWWWMRLWFTLTKWVVLFPIISLPTLAALLALDFNRPWAAVLIASSWLALLLVWRLLDAASFRRWVTGRVAARWRTWRLYKTRWATLCALHGLAPALNGHPVVPRLRKVRIGSTADELRVDLVFGQTLANWSSQSEALAHSFGAQSATVTLIAPGRIKVMLRRFDRLGDPLTLLPAALRPDLEHLTIGVGENGAAWDLRLLGRHLLVAGVTGSGKGSVVWSILGAIGPLLVDGTVQAWVIDPKGGMEFGQGAALFTRFAYDTQTGALELLRDAAATLTRRANLLRGSSRQHIPTPGDPLIVLIIDELASLIAYQTDRKVATEMGQLLALILSQGRAVGVTVIAAVQDPSKDTIAIRQLFPTRIGLRMAEASQVDMVLGAGSRAAGALCDQIPDFLPGVAYMMEDGSATPLRARAFHVTDDDIHHLADRYAPSAPAGEAESVVKLHSRDSLTPKSPATADDEAAS
ncbi:MAG TPA: FtsK/SpoIIIE domain-containing protein [Humibacter sp.]|nr:FtsK/SpoIIIE domain-containing protein [Humibacter sp.]